MKRKKIRRAIIQKAAVVTTLSLCLLQQVAAAENYTTTTTTATSGAYSTDTKAVKAGAPEEAVSKVKMEPKITKEQAVAKIIGLFPKFKEAEVASVTLGNPNVYPPQDEAIWNIQWRYITGNGSSGFNSEVDAITGDVLQVSLSGFEDYNNRTYEYPPKLTEAQAKEVALQWIGKIAPDIDKNTLKEQELYGGTQNLPLFGPSYYSFNYQILVNGLPSENSVSVLLDSNGVLQSYGRSQSELTYPSAQPKVQADEAKKAMGHALDLELSYYPEYSPNGEIKQYYLGYSPKWKSVSSVLDAKTGVFIDSVTGQPSKPATSTYKPLEPTAKPFTPHQGNELTAEEAKSLVTKLLTPPKENERFASNSTADWQDRTQKVWQLSWDSKDFSSYSNRFEARVNVKTGQILTLGYPYSYAYQPIDTTKKQDPAAISRDTAEKKANWWVNQLYPNAAESLKLLTTDGFDADREGHTFIYQQFIHGIPVQMNNVQVVISPTGALKHYEVRSRAIDEASIPAGTPKMTEEQARQLYLDHLQAELRYSRITGKAAEGSAKEIKPELRLVYIPKFNNEDRYVIRTDTGKFVTGWSSDLVINEAKDITGNPEEAALKKLLELRIISPDEEGLVKPNEAIKYGEFMQWIMQAVQSYYSTNRDAEAKPVFKDVTKDSPYYQSASMFIEMRWLQKDPTRDLQPERTLTREQLAEMLSHILQYDKLSQYLSKDSEVAQLQDTAEIENKGAVALMLKLGMMSSDGGKFHPQAAVTRAEAAKMIIKLAEIQGRVDQIILR
ncbi:YcdB/YcdC domain-containing protein [Paenibacillus selenitireducens]|uniref:YcdB/YcdC domain-containing protein n=1 Tax=Paenibacillus selenitireducens TaxID=1324314 RepID=UPI001301E638|nr:YcdB/YcdC domain-containing protein [Paenibacillus selenitireducens]